MGMGPWRSSLLERKPALLEIKHETQHCAQKSKCKRTVPPVSHGTVANPFCFSGVCSRREPRLLQYPSRMGFQDISGSVTMVTQ
eukprot:7045715-Prymnesium_polylepis.1